MEPLNRQQGSSLIVLIGMIAALAILASSLVMLVGNVEHNTYGDRMKATAFNVTEAAVDEGMQTLAKSWPTSSTTTVTFDATAFRTTAPFDDTQRYPNPTNGQFVDVQFYDNLLSLDTNIRYDSNHDDKMYIVAQAGVGPKAARIQALVQRTYFDLMIPRGIALYAGGDLTAGGIGGGVLPKILVEVPPPLGTITSVHVGGTISDEEIAQSGIAQLAGSDAASVDDVFPESLVEGLRTMASQNGRLFTSLATAEASPVNAAWSPQGGLSGLCVIEAPTGTNIKIVANTVLNSEESPGIILVIGGATLEWGGTAAFYGVLYCSNGMSTSIGTADIHGMVVTTSYENMSGTPNILYNDNCIARLLNRWSLNVKLVPNTWRQLTPVSI